MFSFLRVSALLSAAGFFPLRQPHESDTTVSLDYGTFEGFSSGNLTKFLGMPFAKPPINELRFAPPQSPEKLRFVSNATAFGRACPQQNFTTTFEGIPITIPIPPIFDFAEDCLTINVVSPDTRLRNEKLPVVFWIYGGGFEFGGTAQNPGDAIVERSMALKEPIIYVSANYRLNAFGFLSGGAVKDAHATNLGIRDQIFALQWVQKYISSFGGDPDQVTIWGQSAGASSVGYHLVLEESVGLFRAGVMESGSPQMAFSNPSVHEEVYKALVERTNCSRSTASETLECLRRVPFQDIVDFVNSTPQLFGPEGLRLPWHPYIDGDLFHESPQRMVAADNFKSRVPVVIGSVDDEGTLFSLSQRNTTTNAEFLSYVHDIYLRGATPEDIKNVEIAYPDDVTQDSPFNTGTANNLTSQFKRLAAFQGDMFIQAPRRLFLQHASKVMKTYGYHITRGKSTPFLGSFHGSELDEFYGGGPMPDFIGTDALIFFTRHQNPNAPPKISKNVTFLSDIHWPLWSVDEPKVLNLADPQPFVDVIFDDAREKATEILNGIVLRLFG